MANNTASKSAEFEAAESTRALRVDGKVVIADLTVRKSRDGEPVNLTAHIDFTGVSATQILLWAARTKIIDLQRALRLCDLTFLKELSKRLMKQENHTILWIIFITSHFLLMRSIKIIIFY